ncbi:MAG: GNAT family N-acetyltransferase [Vicinamibacterales bacterium]
MIETTPVTDILTVAARGHVAEAEPRWAPAGGWQAGLPVLAGERVVLREVAGSDASALASMVGAGQLPAFMSSFPATREGFARYIDLLIGERGHGRAACFAVVPAGCSQAVGLIEIRPRREAGRPAEWIFAISPQFWGLGIFQEAAQMVVDFAFTAMGVNRLEARVAVKNGRGNGALSKLGASQEAVLRNSLVCGGERLDEVLWTIVNGDWRCYRSDLTTPHIH